MDIKLIIYSLILPGRLKFMDELSPIKVAGQTARCVPLPWFVTKHNIEPVGMSHI